MSNTISIIIPVYNEKESLKELYSEIRSATGAFSKREVLFIDDGSTDGTTELLQTMAEEYLEVTLIQFYRNYGKAAAIAEGFNHATGDYIVTMDADLQDDPSEINNLVEKLDEGYDLVSGWKKTRHDPLTKRWPSKFFNFVTRLMTGVKIHDFNCGLKIYRRAVVKAVEIYGGRHRYIPALAGQKNFKVGEIEVHHRPRKFGITKYGGSRLLHGFFDLVSILFIDRFDQRPLHLFGFFGLFSFLIGLIIEIYVLYLKYELGEPFQKHMALLVFGVMIIVIGVQFFSIGLLGEMHTRSNQKIVNRVQRLIR
ncbi:MAG: glycosyltransferase family 2 protein [Candidatus Neomarinimicrobiota bacterium]|jgi:glycosyltransferase involved in cell wall biosynthesis|nr:glycosyltransferase family 2 protein [Candidatus Neomarinimicrobiota bacterium]